MTITISTKFLVLFLNERTTLLKEVKMEMMPNRFELRNSAKCVLFAFLFYDEFHYQSFWEKEWKWIADKIWNPFFVAR